MSPWNIWACPAFLEGAAAQLPLQLPETGGGSCPVSPGEGRGRRASSGGPGELTLTPTLTDFILWSLGWEPRQCEGLSLPEQALGHLAEVGEGRLSG